MGLLDMGGLLSSGPLSSPDAKIALAAGLLQGTGNLGANLSKGLLAGEQAAQQERLNRQNDLQQLMGSYNLLQQQEAIRMFQAKRAGLPYQPSPMFTQVQSRLGSLLGNPNLSSQGPTGSALPQTPSGPAPQATLPQSAPSSNIAPPSSSVAANPGYQPGPLAGTQPSAAPAPASVPQAGADPFGQPAFGMDPEDFLMGSMNPGIKAYQDALIKARMPQISRGVSFDSQTGLPIAGFVDNVPVQFKNGTPTVMPSAIPQAIADRAGMVTGAQEGAKAPYTFRDVTLASGATVPMSVTQLMGRGAQQSPQQAPQQPSQAPAPGVAQVTVTQPSKQAQAVPQPEQDPWATMPKIPVPQGIGQTTLGKALDVERGAKVTALSNQLGADSDVASSRIATNNQALDLLNSADTGYFANHIAQFRNILGSLGVKSAADQAATDQALGKDLINTALTRGKQLFGSRFTQSEVGIMLSQANPSPQMQNVAAKFLLETDNATQKYAIQKGNDFGRFLGQGGDPLQFSPWYDKAFPLTDAVSKVLPPAQQSMGTGGIRRYNPATGKIE